MAIAYRRTHEAVVYDQDELRATISGDFSEPRPLVIGAKSLATTSGPAPQLTPRSNPPHNTDSASSPGHRPPDSTHTHCRATRNRQRAGRPSSTARTARGQGTETSDGPPQQPLTWNNHSRETRTASQRLARRFRLFCRLRVFSFPAHRYPSVAECPLTAEPQTGRIICTAVNGT